MPSRKAILKKVDDIDFFVGMLGGPEIPTKQDKFKPLPSSEYEIFIEEDGVNRKIIDEELYLKKKADKNHKEFEQKFKDIVKENLTDEHPYKRDEALEVIITVSMTLKRVESVDIDNLAKSILDCLNGLVYEDDNQIISVLASKHVDVSIPLNGLMVGVRRLNNKESWFKGVKLFHFEYKDEP